MAEVEISPLAKRLAEENNVDWRRLAGSGENGKVVERDVLDFLARVMAGEEAVDPTPEPLPEGVDSWIDQDVDQGRGTWTSPDRDQGQATFQSFESSPRTLPETDVQESGWGEDDEGILEVDTAEDGFGAEQDDQWSLERDEPDGGPSAGDGWESDSMSALESSQSEPEIDEDIFLFDEESAPPAEEFRTRPRDEAEGEEQQWVDDFSTFGGDDVTASSAPAEDEPFEGSADSPENGVPSGWDDDLFSADAPVESAADYGQHPGGFGEETPGQGNYFPDDSEAELDGLEVGPEARGQGIGVGPEARGDSFDDEPEASGERSGVETESRGDGFGAESQTQGETYGAESRSRNAFFEDEAVNDETSVAGPSQDDFFSQATGEPGEGRAGVEQFQSSYSTEQTDREWDTGAGASWPAPKEASEHAPAAEHDELDSLSSDEDSLDGVVIEEEETRITRGATSGHSAAQTAGGTAHADAATAAGPADAGGPSDLPSAASGASVGKARRMPGRPGIVLRREVDLTSLVQAQQAVASELGLEAVVPAPFLVRAASRAGRPWPLQQSDDVALALLDDEGIGLALMRGADIVPFRDLVVSCSAARAGDEAASESVGLVVADLSQLGIDEAVLDLGSPVISLGRAVSDGRYRATLSLSGPIAPEAGSRFLERVAQLLAAPIRLVL